jgi:23S rRNA pseudouridine2605 synthase
MDRLNKFLAHAGVGSRRHCDDLIAAGRVKVNGTVVRDMGVKVDAAHQVSVDDQPVKAEKAVYWVLHKPAGYLCTNHDPAGRLLATDLLPHVDQRVYTVGRLDESSEGLLLMTNDGGLAQALMHPRYGVDKTYHVLVAGKPTPADLAKLTEGVWLSDGRVKARSARRIKAHGESTWIKVVLTEGKNREIRRMLAKLDHKVLRLKRVAIGPVELDRLPRGKCRKLSLPELKALQKVAERATQKVADVAARVAAGTAGGEMALPAKPKPRPRRPADRVGGATGPVRRAGPPRRPDGDPPSAVSRRPSARPGGGSGTPAG